MKKFIYILFCFLWISCANETKNKSENTQFDLEDISIDEENYSLDLSPISYENLATQKLIDYFDLLRLKQEHPEFENDIILQLQGFSTDSLSIVQYEKIDSIKNIRQVGAVLKASDSIQKMRLYFDIVSGDKIKSDSILATISTKSVMIDDEMISTNKVTFRKN